MTTPSPRCSVHIRLGSPSFVPGSRLVALLTLRAPSHPAAQSSTSLPTTTNSTASSATQLAPSNSASHRPPARGFVSSEPAIIVDYLVCEVAARWSAEKAWVIPDVHTGSEVLDRASSQDEEGEDSKKPWDAAFADGNLVGGGVRAGYSGLVYRSPAHVVCEAEQIPRGGQVSFSLECVLPDQIPPTLRGTAIRYSHALIVVAAVRDAAAKDTTSVPRVIRVPFRVVTSDHTAAINSGPSYDIVPVPTPPHVGPKTNVFLEENDYTALDIKGCLVKTTPPDDIEIALALSLNGRLTPYPSDGDAWKTTNANYYTARAGDDYNYGSHAAPAGASPATVGNGSTELQESHRVRSKSLPVYSISQGPELVAKMFMAKRIHHLGDTITAAFDFTAQTLPCYRLSARLEVQEIVASKCALGARRRIATAAKENIVFRKIFGEHEEYTIWNKNTQVTFTIPHDAPVSFATEAVQVRWFLHFTFLTPLRKGRTENDESDVNDRNDNTVDDDEEVEESTTLLNRVSFFGRQQSSRVKNVADTSYAIPQKEVDVLQWTLPLTVTGVESGWGLRPSAVLRIT